MRDDLTPTPGLNYVTSYWCGLLLTAILAVIGAIEVGWNAGMGAALGLTPQQFALISLVGVFLGVIGRAFPNVQYTPRKRNAEFRRAVQRMTLPKDVKIHEN